MLNSDELHSMYVDNHAAVAGGPDILTRILGYFKNSALETVMWESYNHLNKLGSLGNGYTKKRKRVIPVDYTLWKC
jgi:acetoacetate decarboxylase